MFLAFQEKSLSLTAFSKHRIQHAQAFWQIGLSERQGTRPFLTFTTAPTVPRHAFPRRASKKPTQQLNNSTIIN